MVLPRNCRGCLRIDDWGKCQAFKAPYKDNCPSKCTNPSQIIRENEQLIVKNIKNTQYTAECRRIIKRMKAIIYKEIYSAYQEDVNRGSGGGGSKNNKNSNAAIKQKMKDNRPLECKQTKGEIEHYKEELNEWQEEKGEKLDIHKSIGYGMSRSNVDSYTGLQFGELSDDDIIEAADKLLMENKISQEKYDEIIFGKIEI